MTATKREFEITDGDYSARIVENPSGSFAVVYYLHGRVFDRSNNNYFGREEAIRAALETVIEQMEIA